MKSNRLNYAELYVTANRVSNLLSRDMNKFMNYGINETSVENFKKVFEKYNEIDQDEIFLGMQMMATESKNKSREQLEDAIKCIMLMVENTYTRTNVFYIQFRNFGLKEVSDAELLRKAITTINLISRWEDQLNESGIEQKQVDALKMATDDFCQKMSLQDNSIKEREYYTQLRANRADDLFFLISKYCNIGRRMWQGENPAYSNDYVIADSPKSSGNNASPPVDEASKQNIVVLA